MKWRNTAVVYITELLIWYNFNRFIIYIWCSRAYRLHIFSSMFITKLPRSGVLVAMNSGVLESEYSVVLVWSLVVKWYV